MINTRDPQNEAAPTAKGWIGEPGDTARQFVLRAQGKLPIEFPIWIIRQESKRDFSGCACPLSTDVLVVSEESAAELLGRFGIKRIGPKTSHVCVCRCQGRFIE